MSTSIQYGDILLRDCATRLFEQKTEFDSDGITAKFYAYRVSVVGYFVTNSQAGFEGPAIDTTGTGPMPAGARYTTLREALTTPRLPFRMTTGTGTAQQTTILEALPAPENPGNYTPGQTLSENLDRNGGPKVVSLQIQDIYANKTFRVNVTFEISLRPLCGVSAGADVPQMAYGVISNRWSCSDNIDSNRFTTRTYNGELTLSSPTINPHEFRFLCLPPLAEGFRRADMEFVGQKDNLKLRYMIRDEQVTVSAPGFGNEFSDGTEIEVRQEDNVAQMATFVTTHLSVKLKGGPRAQRRTLVQIAAAYVDAKLQLHRQVRPLDEPRAPRNVFVESYVLQEEFGTSKTNQVGISIILKRTPDSEEYAQERLVKNVLKTFGNEVNGAALAGVTEDPVLTAFLVDYNHLQSYGNRTYPSGVLPNETPQPYGGTQVAATLANHLQHFCTADFSPCSGIGESNARTAQIAESRPPCEPTRLSYAIRSVVPDLTNDTLSESSQENPYEHYRVESAYKNNPMTMSLPRAIRVNSEFTSGPMPRKDNELEPAHSTAIRIGPPQHCRTISVVAIRWGKPPALPPPHETFVDAEQNVHTLIDADVIPMAPELNGNHDNRKFQANATYVYALSHPPKSYLSGVPEYERGDINTGALIDFIYDQDELFGGRAVEYRESRV